MSTFILNIAVLSVPALLVGVMRHKWWWSWILVIATIFAGLLQQVLLFSDVWMLPLATGLLSDAWPVMIWLLWSITLSSAVSIRQTSLKTSAVLGLCLGQMAAPMLFEQDRLDNKCQHTTASWLGAMLLPAGTIGAAQLWTAGFAWLWIWVPVLFGMWLMGIFKSELVSLKESIDKPWVLIVTGFTMLVTSYCSEWGHWLMGIEIPVWLGLSILGKHNLNWQSILSWAGVFYLVNLAVAGGLAESAGWGLEEMPMELHSLLFVGVFVSAGLATMLVGIIPTTLFGYALLSRTMDLASVGISLHTVQLVYVLGLMVGNWNPWICSKTWYQQWKSRILVSSVTLCFVAGTVTLLT